MISMSLYGVLRTGVSGMNAQANKLGTIADNIANTSTTGYKRASTEFSSLLLENNQKNYQSGAVQTKVRYAISEQGSLTYTTSATDLAIQGNGFMVVSDKAGVPFLTRAGSFTVDAATGNLVNTAGYTLMGYDVSDGDPNVVLNGTGELEPVNLSSMNLQAKPSTEGTFVANLPANSDVVTGDLPSDNTVDSTYSTKSSIVAYDNLGNEVTLDVYFTKTSASPIEWEMTVFDQADAASGGGFPYSSAALDTSTLAFGNTGQLTSTPSIAFNVPGGSQLTLDLTGMTQLAADYTPLNIAVDGNAPSTVSGVVIQEDGTVYATYQNGAKAPAFRIPLADVASPDNLEPLAGNVFATTAESGDLQIGFPEEGGRGTLISGALEQSNVDMAAELTDMIVAQRDYSANSKVVQTGSELLEVLINLKR
jgi:flagellar hook protein FlgE